MVVRKSVLRQLRRLRDRHEDEVRALIAKAVRDGERSQEIHAFVMNIEHIGDITANNLMEFAAKKAESGQDFSAEDIQDLAIMHAQVMESLRLEQAARLDGIQLATLEGNGKISVIPREAD